MKALSRTLLCCLCGMLFLSGCQAAEANEAEASERKEVTDEDKAQVEETLEADEETDLGLLEYVEQREYATTEGIELDPGTYIAVVGKGKDSTFWKQVKEGATQAIADLNKEMGYTGSDKIYMTYDAPAEEDNVDQQINVLDEALGSTPYPDAVCLAVVDVQAFATQFDYMVENSIPTVAFDSGTDNENLLSLSATDNKAAAEEAAARLCEMIGGEGQIAVLMHNDISETGIAREKAFLSYIEEYYPDVQVVDVSYLNDNEADAEDQVAEVLERYPDLDGYFASNYDAEEVVRTACSKAARTEVRKVSFDGTEAQIAAVRSGELDGTVVQNPYAMGYTSVIAAARAIMELENETAETELVPYINTGYMWIDADNLDSEEVSAFIK